MKRFFASDAESDMLIAEATKTFGLKIGDIINMAIKNQFLPITEPFRTEARFILQRHTEGALEAQEIKQSMTRGIRALGTRPVRDADRLQGFFARYHLHEDRYGEENVVQAIVHDDEGGQPHLHFCFVPVVEDPKHEQGYKICANDVLDRRELRNFHPDLQRYLNEHGLEDARVMTGVTKRQGGNRTVAQLKAEREYQQEVERPALYFGESKIEQGLHF